MSLFLRLLGEEHKGAALEAANIRLIHVFWDHDTAQVTVVGFDNRFRSLP